MLSEFAYSGIDPSGKEGRGTISAADRTEALARLRARGLTVTDLRQKESGGRLFSGSRKINSQDLYYLARELGTLLRSGMQIDKALEIIVRSSGKRDMQDTLSSILKGIRAGRSVTDSFRETGRFSPFLLSMIQNSEEIGQLATAFENIASYLQFQIRFRAEIREALTYPVFLVIASFVTFFVIFHFIVPRFLGIFGASAASLPGPARLLFALSGMLDPQNLIIVALAIAAVCFLGRLYPSGTRFSRLRGRVIDLPVAGKLILDLELSRFCYSMHAMLQGGVEFIKALRLSTGLVHNAGLREELAGAAGRIREGVKIADAFARVSNLPALVTDMIRVGEESGSLREIFFELHQVFDERFKNGVKRGLALLEPAIIIVMGLLVGFIVLTLIQTVMSVGSVKL